MAAGHVHYPTSKQIIPTPTDKQQGIHGDVHTANRQTAYNKTSITMGISGHEWCLTAAAKTHHHASRKFQVPRKHNQTC